MSGALEIGIAGLRAAQIGLQTTGHNITNASTPGYHRQEIMQSANTAVNTGAGFIGTGVSVDAVKRVSGVNFDVRKAMPYSSYEDFDFEAAAKRPADRSDVIDPDDPYEVIVQHLHSSFTQPTGARVKLIVDLCKELSVDGVFYHNHLGCRYPAGDAMMVRDAILKELGIPVLMLEWDNFDPRSYNQQQYEAKLETFRTMMEASKRPAPCM